MTDQRLRDLERAAAHGDLQAQARLLLERVRVGDLTEERLRLAAYLGDEAARVGVGEDTGFFEAARWMTALQDAPRPVRATVAVALARLTFELSAPHDRDVEALLRAIEFWIACPCHEHLVEASQVAGSLPWAQVERGRRKLAAHKAAVVAQQVAVGMHDEGRLDDFPFSPDCWETLLSLAREAGAEPDLLAAATGGIAVAWLLAPRPSP